MSEISRRGFFGAAAAGIAVSSALGDPQSAVAPPGAALPASPDRKFSMKLGVHMTNWQVLLEKKVMTWDDIGRVSAELGFKGIELQGAGLDKMDKAGLKNIKDALTSHGLKIVAINIGNNFLDPNFEGQIKMVTDFAELCAWFEAPFERIYLGRKPPEMKDSQAFDLVRKGLETCLPVWEKLNIVAAPEAPDVFRLVAQGAAVVPEVLPPQYPAGDISAIVTLLRIVNSRYFRYTIDTGCIPPDEKYLWPTLLAPYAVNMHLKEWQFHWRTGEPVDTDYVRFLAPLKKAGYDGFIDLELRDPTRLGFDLGDTVAEVSGKLRRLKAHMQECIAA